MEEEHEKCKHALDCAYCRAFSRGVDITRFGSREGYGSSEGCGDEQMSCRGSQTLSGKVL